MIELRLSNISNDHIFEYIKSTVESLVDKELKSKDRKHLRDFKEEIVNNSIMNIIIHLYYDTAKNKSMNKLRNNGLLDEFASKLKANKDGGMETSSLRRRFDTINKDQLESSINLLEGDSSKNHSGIITPYIASCDEEQLEKLKDKKNFKMTALDYLIFISTIHNDVINHFLKGKEVANKNVSLSDYIDEYDGIGDIIGIVRTNSEIPPVIEAMFLYMLEAHLYLRYVFCIAEAMASNENLENEDEQIKTFCNILTSSFCLVMSNNLYYYNLFCRNGSVYYPNNCVLGLNKAFIRYKENKDTAEQTVNLISNISMLVLGITETMAGNSTFAKKSFKQSNYGLFTIDENFFENNMALNEFSKSFSKAIYDDVTQNMITCTDKKTIKLHKKIYDSFVTTEKYFNSKTKSE